MKEKNYDELLCIKTARDKREDAGSIHYHRYEPTPYMALEELFKKYKLNSDDQVVDFGCGKGRLNFFAHYLFGSTVIGVEMNEGFIQGALENRKSYLKKFAMNEDKIIFKNCLAEEYEIQALDNRFYFFNPFTIQIFRKVINHILFSVEQTERVVELILYYGSEEYMYYLQNYTSFQLIQEITLNDTNKDPFERFLIYRLS